MIDVVKLCTNCKRFVEDAKGRAFCVFYNSYEPIIHNSKLKCCDFWIDKRIIAPKHAKHRVR